MRHQLVQYRFEGFAMEWIIELLHGVKVRIYDYGAYKQINNAYSVLKLLIGFVNAAFTD